jgi:hypothetical protein
MRKHPILGDMRPYNFISPEGRQVTAWMSVERDYRLGALLIEAMDGQETGQVVYGMPKIHYPYRRDKKIDLENVTPDDIVLPTGYERVLLRQKVDGTNVCWFGLLNGKGEIVEVIPKTRQAVLNKPSEMHSVYDLLPDIYEMYPGIPQAVRETGLCLSFEVYGYRNSHTLVYDFPLQVSLIVAVDGEGRLRPWEELVTIAEKYKLHMPEVIFETTKPDVRAEWLRFRLELDERNRLDRLVDEGVVFTFCYPDTMRLVKCKTKTLEEAHMSVMAAEQAEIPREILFKAICRVYDDGFAGEGWDVVWGQLKAELMEDYVEVAVNRHVHKARKLWDWKLRLERVRPFIERAMKETGSRELDVVMPVVRRWLSKEQTNLAAQILIRNI